MTDFELMNNNMPSEAEPLSPKDEFAKSMLQINEIAIKSINYRLKCDDCCQHAAVLAVQLAMNEMIRCIIGNLNSEMEGGDHGVFQE